MISLLFAVGVLVITGMAFLGRETCLQKLSLVMVASWSISKLTVDGVGHDGATYVLPVVDALWAVYVMALAIKDRCAPCITTLCLFFIMALTHVAFHLTDTAGGLAYWRMLNILFALQLLAIGYWGAKHAEWHWFTNRFSVLGHRVGRTASSFRSTEK